MSETKDQPLKRDDSMGDGDDDLEESNAGYDDLLAKFYGVNVADGPAGGEGADGEADVDPRAEGSGGEGEKEAAAKAQKAKLERERAKPQSKTDLDSEAFEAPAYVEEVLNKQGIQGLLQEEAIIKNQVRNLESDMQMLVYENYNKFISATDMIRKMKTNVESMEEEMKRLSAKMSSISTKCESLEGSLEGNRDKMENLVGVNRLLQRLQFLFQLPNRLNKSIQIKAYGQAVRYYKVSHKILRRYKTIASFEKISTDSAKIIQRLTTILNSLLHDPNQNPLTKMENAGLLLELHEPPEKLWKALFSSISAKLSLFLKEPIPPPTPLPKHEQHKKTAENQPGSGGGGGGGDEAAASEAKAAGDGHHPPMALVTLERGFVSTFTTFARTFQETFDGRQGAQQALSQFATKAFEPYFERVSRILHQQAIIPADADQEQAATRFRTALSTFYRQLTAPSSSVSSANIANKGAQVIEGGIRVMVESVMELTIKKIKSLLLKIYKHAAALSKRERLVTVSPEIEAFLQEKTTTANTADDKKGAKPPSAGTEGDGEAKGGEAPAEGGEEGEEWEMVEDWGDLKQLDANAAAEKIREIVEESVSALMPVLNVRTYLPPGLFIGLSFANLARGHLSHVLEATLKTLQIGVGVSSGGAGQEHICSVPGKSLLEENAPGLPDRELPLFLLFLSQVCARMHSTHVGVAWEGLTRTLQAKQAGQHKGVDVYQGKLPVLQAKYKAVSRALMMEYAKVRGGMCMDWVPGRDGLKLKGTIPLNPNDRDPKNMAPSEYAVNIANLLRQTYREIEIFFGPNLEKPDRGGHPHSGRSANAVGQAMSMLRMSSDEKYLNRDIERMFRERVDVLNVITPNRVAPMRAVFRILAKGFTERVRFRTLSVQEALQLQLDLHCLRRLVPSLLDGAEGSGVEMLMEEAVTLTGDRVREAFDMKNRVKSALAEYVYDAHLKAGSSGSSNPLAVQ